MNFESLQRKVRQAEVALEAKERQASADWRQVKSTWLASWTPGRIIVAGLVSGFVVGKLEPGKSVAKGNTLLQMLTAVAGMVAGTGAQAAAGKAEDAAQSAEQVAQAPPVHA